MPRRSQPAGEALPGLEDVAQFVGPAFAELADDVPPFSLGRLPAVRLCPAAQLAPIARAAPLLVQAEELARWAAARGVRPTKRGGLRVADARAATELGLPLLGAAPGRGPAQRAGKTAGAAVERLWQTAVGAKFVVVEGTAPARPGPALDVLAAVDRGDAAPADVVDVWCTVLDAAVARSGLAVPTLLLLYVSSDPLAPGDLVDAVLESPFAGPVSTSSVLGGALVQAVRSMGHALVEELEALAVVELADGAARLTELGLLGAHRALREIGFDAPAVHDLADADALAAFDLAGRSGERRDEVLSEWVAARGQPGAAAELVTMAADGGAVDRATAFALLASMDEAAEGAVRSALEREDLRPYAVGWLTARGLPAPEMSLQFARWIVVDALQAALEMAGPDAPGAAVGEAVGAALSAVGPAEQQKTVVPELADSGHPATAEVLEALRLHHPDRAVARAAGKSAVRLRRSESSASSARRGRAAGTAYQLKITLLRLRPPVWRRVVVPGSLTLYELHRVIQVAMGWSDSHLHEFEVDGVQYGEPNPEFAGFGAPVLPEGRVHLAEVAGPGTRIRYVYDFGDDWRHEIVVESTRPVEPGERLPVCTAGRRACPPEDVGGPWGYADFVAAYSDPSHPDHEEYLNWAGAYVDPAQFDKEETTRLLRRELS